MVLLRILCKKNYLESPDHAITKLMCSYNGWMREKGNDFLKIQANKKINEQ